MTSAGLGASRSLLPSSGQRFLITNALVPVPRPRRPVPGVLGKPEEQPQNACVAASVQVIPEVSEIGIASSPNAIPVDASVLARRTRLRSLTRSREPRPTRVDLERACRIALLESDGPVSVEAIYDRIVRRGSIAFQSYKRPFRAISIAMAQLTRQGNAILVTGHEASSRLRRNQRFWSKPNLLA